jgi:hypothetical protein
MQVLKRLAPVAAIGSLGMLATQAHAAAPTTVGELASSVSFTDVGAAILAVAGTLVTLYVVWKGAKFVIRAVRGG